MSLLGEFSDDGDTYHDHVSYWSVIFFFNYYYLLISVDITY